MTKFVVSGYIGFNNFGDEAIAKVLTTYLKTINPEKITVISSNPKKTSEMFGVDSVGMLDFIQPIINSDVLISGGGSLLQDITSLKSLLYYLSIIMLALVFNKKVVIFAQGFTPFRTKIGKFLTGFVLKRCEKIYVRDNKSHFLLKDLGIDSNIVSDPVFGIEVPSVIEKNGVGIQLRDFFSMNDKFLDKLSEEIVKNFGDKTIKLFSLQDNLDLEILVKFKQKLLDKGVKSEIYNNLTVEETIEELSKLEYLVGMRFHSNLVAVKAGVKVLGINYDVKVLTLSQDIGFSVINIEQEDFSQEFDKLKTLDVSKYKIPEFIFPEI